MKFGRFEIDSVRRVLLYDGQVVPLKSRAFDVVEFLAIHHDRFASRDEIETAVWRGQAIGDNNLRVQMSSLRQGLAKCGATDAIITRPGVGYRFVGDAPERPDPGEALLAAGDGGVDGNVQAHTPQNRRNRAWVSVSLSAIVLAGGVGLWMRTARLHAAPPRLSIAVLPFRNLSADPSEQYMADAVTDDLRNDLARIPGSTVIARESAAAAAAKTPQKVGQDLNVRYEIEGSLMPEDGHYHVTAALIDTATAAQLWAADLNVTRDKVSSIRETVVHHIASRLHFELDQVESQRSVRDRPDNPDALDRFFRARSRLDWDHSLAGLGQAQRQLEQAIQHQPGFTDAQAELGWMLLRKVTTLDDPDEDHDYAEAKRAIAQALAASPENPKAMAARAREYEVDGHCPAAIPVAERVLDIEPSSIDARVVLVACALSDLRFADAASFYEEILRLDPDSPANKPRYLALGLIDLVQGHYADAIKRLAGAQSDDASAMDEMGPGEQARYMLIAAEQLDGQTAQAHADEVAYDRMFPYRTVFRISGYLQPGWLKVAGVQDMLGALQAAGMPQFADENEPGVADGAPCTGTDFAMTPRSLPGGAVILTERLSQLLHGPSAPIVLDVGRGIVPIENSQLFDAATGETKAQFVLRAATKFSGQTKDAAIVVAGDGVTGCDAYNAAKSLIDNGFSHVSWYRGGEEAWRRWQLKTATVVAHSAK